MKVTYYVEMFSSWCYWAEPTWTELKKRYEGRVQFDWKIALMRKEDFPGSIELCDWYYQRSGTIMKSPFKLNSGWVDFAGEGDYANPNIVAEAARSLGKTDDTVRLALMHAALREGQKMSILENALKVAAAASDLDQEQLKTAVESKPVRDRVAATTAEFHQHQITQRPAFVLEDDIADKAVFSGLVRLEPLAATIEAMLSDSAAYVTHRVHFGQPPKV
jgi:predicted DsbA family dithiol-disulfide isomerase